MKQYLQVIIVSGLTFGIMWGCSKSPVMQSAELDEPKAIGINITSDQYLKPNKQVAQSLSMVSGLSERSRKSQITVSNSDIAYELIQQPVSSEVYAHYEENPVKLVTEQPVSTFSIDVDTGSYSNVRRMLKQGQQPHVDAVRIEEMINYFDFSYAEHANSDHPFSVVTEIGQTPWNKHSKLLHIGIQANDVALDEGIGSNLVFLVDVSGSMNSPNKLGLLKSSLKLLTNSLTEKDRISIVVYAGASGVVLEPTEGNDKFAISSALQSLSAGGSTNGAGGIKLAYELAQREYIEDGINRIIIATDGDFNVGLTDFEALKQLVAQKRETGISLSTLGFGQGNYNDRLMEQLADVGNGNYAYIDTLNEARKVLVDQAAATLKIVASDVKIQMEFNPAIVSEYRLVGYENRQLDRADFNNDRVDAGDIGSGHTVTALYEINLVNSEYKNIDPLRYEATADKTVKYSSELGFLRLRYKRPNEKTSQLIEHVIIHQDSELELTSTSVNFRFAASVAAFAEKLRGGKYVAEFSWDDVLKLARSSRGTDLFGYRGEFLQLTLLAQSLDTQKEWRPSKAKKLPTDV